MIQQDLRSVNGYVLGIAGLIIALFIPFAALILKIFKSNAVMGAFFLGVFVPFIAIVLGSIGLIKSSKQSTSLTKMAKILNILAIIISILLIAFNLYIFIKSGGLA
ncbi:MAG: hypothetical protein AABY32_04855 [Nanoarchaeota archaeon]